MSKKKKLRIENGVVVGTASDKYENRNFVVRKLIQGFDNGIRSLLETVDPSSITEIGCGEGHATEILLDNTKAQIQAFDISETIVNESRESIPSQRVTFAQSNIYEMSPEKHQADLVVCCEVLEHLDDPEKGLQILSELAKPYALLSVPREPLWRILNMMRGAYLKDLGNTPGHYQHWSKNGFLEFVSQRFDIIRTVAPIPWTMVLVKIKQ